MPQLRRSPLILKDFDELWTDKEKAPKNCPVVQEYLKYIFDIKEDKDRIMAHVYVRHMGDLSGGQMIAKRVPGKGQMYHFDADHEELKTKIKAKLNDNMADEAKVCFEFAIKLFQQLEEA
jgi:heme oxygenase